MNITAFEYTPAKISDSADPSPTLSGPAPAKASFCSNLRVKDRGPALRAEAYRTIFDVWCGDP